MSFHFEQLYLVFAARPFPENVPLLHSRMFIINHSNNNNNQKLNEMFCMYKEISYLYEKWFENLVFWLPVCFSLNCFIFMSHIFFLYWCVFDQNWNEFLFNKNQFKYVGIHLKYNNIFDTRIPCVESRKRNWFWH